MIKITEVEDLDKMVTVTHEHKGIVFDNLDDFVESLASNADVRNRLPNSQRRRLGLEDGDFSEDAAREYFRGLLVDGQSSVEVLWCYEGRYVDGSDKIIMYDTRARGLLSGTNNEKQLCGQLGKTQAYTQSRIDIPNDEVAALLETPLLPSEAKKYIRRIHSAPAASQTLLRDDTFLYQETDLELIISTREQGVILEVRPEDTSDIYLVYDSKAKTAAQNFADALGKAIKGD